MSKLLVVFGATGQQGGSIIKFVLNDPELSKQFSIRGLTRDPTKPDAQALAQQGVEVVKADVTDKESIEKALQGAHTVYAVTITITNRTGKEQEISQGKTIADVAVAAGVQYLIWSTSQHCTSLSNNTLQNVSHFDSKADVEDYIRTLPIQSAFFNPGSFMQNYTTHSIPRPLGDTGTYAIFNIMKPTTEVPLIDITDTGKWVGAILAEPEKYAGKVLCAATRIYTIDEIARILSAATGKEVVHQEIPVEVYKGFLPKEFDVELVEMNLWLRDYGYYGPNQRELVEWSVKQARGKPTTLEEFLEKNPIRLQ